MLSYGQTIRRAIAQVLLNTEIGSEINRDTLTGRVYSASGVKPAAWPHETVYPHLEAFNGILFKWVNKQTLIRIEKNGKTPV